uniref:(northern house mosquito) hypothetical protein n=1 Tax=Culex pipiens TaxID=7175 RepID=A0A8D8C167_CULPI
MSKDLDRKKHLKNALAFSPTDSPSTVAHFSTTSVDSLRSNLSVRKSTSTSFWIVPCSSRKFIIRMVQQTYFFLRSPFSAKSPYWTALGMSESSGRSSFFLHLVATSLRAACCFSLYSATSSSV